jgi:outer membrane murein-binding lipoprotein Lpp
MNQKKIQALRGQIKTLQFERTALENQRLSRSEVGDKVRGTVQRWETEAAEQNRLHLLWLAHDHGGVNLLTAPTTDTGAAGVYAKLGPAAVLLLGAEVVAERLLAGIDEVPEGVDTDERLTRIAEIGAELDRLEAEEEALICAAEAEGIEVLRRPDARPEIVLAQVT